METLSWYLLKGNIDMATISELLKKESLNQAGNSGFRITSRNNAHISSIFFEKVEQTKFIEYPDGSKNEVLIEDYLLYKFTIFNCNGKKFFRIKGKHRTYKPLNNALFRIFGLNLAIKEVRLNITDIIDLIYRNLDAELTVNSLEIYSNGFGASVGKSVHCFQGTQDVRKDVESFFNGMPYHVKKLGCTLLFDNGKCNLEISQSGKISYKGINDTFIYQRIEPLFLT
jgi:hypothetical protein